MLATFQFWTDVTKVQNSPMIPLYLMTGIFLSSAGSSAPLMYGLLWLYGWCLQYSNTESGDVGKCLISGQMEIVFVVLNQIY